MRRCHKTVMLSHPSGNQWTNRQLEEISLSVSSEVVPNRISFSFLWKIWMLYLLFLSPWFQRHDAPINTISHWHVSHILQMNLIKKTGTKTWQWPHLSPTSLCICLSQNKLPLYWNNCRVIANTTHNVLCKPVLYTFLLFFLTVRLDAASMRRDFLKGKICRSYFSFLWCLLSLY